MSCGGTALIRICPVCSERFPRGAGTRTDHVDRGKPPTIRTGRKSLASGPHRPDPDSDRFGARQEGSGRWTRRARARRDRSTVPRSRRVAEPTPDRAARVRSCAADRCPADPKPRGASPGRHLVAGGLRPAQRTFASGGAAPSRSMVNGARDARTPEGSWPTRLLTAHRAGVRKREVFEELGESTLLLPALVAGGLEANDRAKYFLTLLQAARETTPTRPCATMAPLRDERLAAGVADSDFDSVVERCAGRGRRLLRSRWRDACMRRSIDAIGRCSPHSRPHDRPGHPTGTGSSARRPEVPAEQRRPARQLRRSHDLGTSGRAATRSTCS